MGAHAAENLPDVGKFSERNLSLHVRDFVKNFLDTLVLDVSVPHVSNKNSQDLADATVEEDIKIVEEIIKWPRKVKCNGCIQVLELSIVNDLLKNWWIEMKSKRSFSCG